VGARSRQLSQLSDADLVLSPGGKGGLTKKSIIDRLRFAFDLLRPTNLRSFVVELDVEVHSTVVLRSSAPPRSVSFVSFFMLPLDPPPPHC
jgi:hypothetical protein